MEISGSVLERGTSNPGKRPSVRAPSSSAIQLISDKSVACTSGNLLSSMFEFWYILYRNIQLYVLSSLTIFEKKESNIFDGGGVGGFWRGIITYLTPHAPPSLRLALRWLLCIKYSTIQLGDSCRQRVLFFLAQSQTIYINKSTLLEKTP